MAASASQLLGDVLSVAADAHVALAADVGHGRLVLAPDGSFTYRPTAGYVGPDSFRYVLTTGKRGERCGCGRARGISRHRAVSQPEGWLCGRIDRSRWAGSARRLLWLARAAVLLSFEWLIPSFVVSGPGLLVLFVIGAQLLAGGAWLPLVRRRDG